MKNQRKTIISLLLILMLTTIVLITLKPFSPRDPATTVIDKNHHRLKTISPAQASKNSQLGH